MTEMSHGSLLFSRKEENTTPVRFKDLPDRRRRNRIRQKFNDIRDENPEIVSQDTKYVDDFENLNVLYKKKIREWQIITDLKNECVPEIYREFISGSVYSGNILRYSKKIGFWNCDHWKDYCLRKGSPETKS